MNSKRCQTGSHAVELPQHWSDVVTVVQIRNKIPSDASPSEGHVSHTRADIVQCASFRSLLHCIPTNKRLTRWDRQPDNHTFRLLSKHGISLPVWPHCWNARRNRCHEDHNSFPLWELEETSGRPHTKWMKTIHQDLKSNNLTLNEAIDVAQNRPLWRLVSTLVLYTPSGACQKWRRRRSHTIRTRDRQQELMCVCEWVDLRSRSLLSWRRMWSTSWRVRGVSASYSSSVISVIHSSSACKPFTSSQSVHQTSKQRSNSVSISRVQYAHNLS